METLLCFNARCAIVALYTGGAKSYAGNVRRLSGVTGNTDVETPLVRRRDQSPGAVERSAGLRTRRVRQRFLFAQPSEPRPFKSAVQP